MAGWHATGWSQGGAGGGLMTGLGTATYRNYSEAGLLGDAAVANRGPAYLAPSAGTGREREREEGEGRGREGGRVGDGKGRLSGATQHTSISKQQTTYRVWSGNLSCRTDLWFLQKGNGKPKM